MKLFLLKVKGTSMSQADIMDGDLVVINPSDKLVDGEIMAVKFQGVSMIKRVRVIKHNVRLLSEDGSGSSMTTRKEYVVPQGIVLGSLGVEYGDKDTLNLKIG